jgi:hypothetical protein
MAPDDEPKVKELLAGASLESVVDEAAQRELEKWFQLPSFDQAAEARSDEDPEVAEVRERRARACAAVDPALLETIHVRTEVTPETLLRFEARIDVRIREDIALFDYAMAEKGHAIAEPREVEIDDELKDDLREVTPQALLRDLHRPETEFDKLFEVVDMAAEQRFDIVAEVATAMATSWKLPPLGPSPFEEERRGLALDRENRRRPWTELPMSNRRVSE